MPDRHWGKIISKIPVPNCTQEEEEALSMMGSEKDEEQLGQNAALQNSLWVRLRAWRIPAATHLPSRWQCGRSHKVGLP